jgi:deoxyribonuclease-4
MALLFGTGGIPLSVKKDKPEEGVREIKRLGLDCMELEFVYGVRMTEKGAELVRAAQQETGVQLTAHGPYYINLASLEKDKLAASRQRVLDTARRCFQCGGKSITFHAAFFQGRGKEEVLKIVAAQFQAVMDQLAKEKVNIDVRPELSGKPSQVGSLGELIKIGEAVKGVLPAIDFAHFYAREAGRYNTYEDFCGALDELAKAFGKGIWKNMHIHISGIEYTAKGERKHKNLQESDFNWKDCVKAFADYKLEGFCICESPSLEKDALLLKQTFKKFSRGKK